MKVLVTIMLGAVILTSCTAMDTLSQDTESFQTSLNKSSDLNFPTNLYEYSNYILQLLCQEQYDVLEQFITTDRISRVRNLKAKSNLTNHLKTLKIQQLEALLSKIQRESALALTIRMVLQKKYSAHL